MVKLILISGKKLCKILEKLGFEKIYGKGSHIRFKHPDGRRTIVPVHANEDLGKGLLREILKQIKLSKEQYEELRRSI
ncbi:MAG: type II toxin-antitoxin system HicA family toxin [Nanoarchaeota archaeon]|nr:type II toxin-antitoxin system HicA family toxin [Nanoarchaeota archaeon]MBU4116215.1 type II toxin-antitoxin system HicA family toxin [Nanoarchaeota archaeon]